MVLKRTGSSNRPWTSPPPAGSRVIRSSLTCTGSGASGSASRVSRLWINSVPNRLNSVGVDSSATAAIFASTSARISGVSAGAESSTRPITFTCRTLAAPAANTAAVAGSSAPRAAARTIPPAARGPRGSTFATADSGRRGYPAAANAPLRSNPATASTCNCPTRRVNSRDSTNAARRTSSDVPSRMRSTASRRRLTASARTSVDTPRFYSNICAESREDGPQESLPARNKSYVSSHGYSGPGTSPTATTYSQGRVPYAAGTTGQARSRPPQNPARQPQPRPSIAPDPGKIAKPRPPSTPAPALRRSSPGLHPHVHVDRHRRCRAARPDRRAG